MFLFFFFTFFYNSEDAKFGIKIAFINRKIHILMKQEPIYNVSKILIPYYYSSHIFFSKQ